MHNDEQFVSQALWSGARGSRLKHAMDSELFEVLGTVLRGERYIPPTIDMEKVETQDEKDSELTAREREMLQLVSDGQRHKTSQTSSISVTIGPRVIVRT
jgi:DNA-binding NarL/FixJ family response regulator